MLVDVRDEETLCLLHRYLTVLSLPTDRLRVTTRPRTFVGWLGRRISTSLGGAYAYLPHSDEHLVLVNLDRINRSRARAVEIVVAEELIHMRDRLDGDLRRHARHGHDRIAIGLQRSPVPRSRRFGLASFPSSTALIAICMVVRGAVDVPRGGFEAHGPVAGVHRRLIHGLCCASSPVSTVTPQTPQRPVPPLPDKLTRRSGRSGDGSFAWCGHGMSRPLVRHLSDAFVTPVRDGSRRPSRDDPRE